MIKRWLSILLIGLTACIDPYEVEVEEERQLLTVDGNITTQLGPHRIRLTRSTIYGSVFDGVITPVRNAQVVIRDGQGNITFLSPGRPGEYFTPANFSAIVGETYNLEIVLSSGETYSSLPETIRPVPPIGNVRVRSQVIATEDILQDRIGAQIIIDFNDPADEPNFYFWTLANPIFVLRTQPQLFTLPPTDPANPRGPAPKDCCDQCFLADQVAINSIPAASDEDFNGLATSRGLFFIEDDGLRFQDTYRIDVQQMSITPEAYRFMRLAQQQLEITGSVFDPLPANIRGNIVNINNPDEPVLGFFFAADVSTRQIYIKNQDLSILQTPAIIPDDCREVDGAVLSPPLDWNP